MFGNSILKRAVQCAALFSLLGAVASPAVALERTTLLEPVSGWHVELTDGICRLSRSYSAEGQQAVLAMEHFGEWNSFSITVAGEAVARAKANSASVHFGPAFPPHEREAERGRIKGVGEAILLSSGGLALPREQNKSNESQAGAQAAEVNPAGAEWLRIEQFPGNFLRFPLPKFGEAYAVLDQSVDAMVESWGFDPAGQRAFQTGPKVREQASWVNDISFPIRELREGFDGRIWLRFNVDAAGLPTSCTTVKSADA